MVMSMFDSFCLKGMNVLQQLM